MRQPGARSRPEAYRWEIYQTSLYIGTCRERLLTAPVSTISDLLVRDQAPLTPVPVRLEPGVERVNSFGPVKGHDANTLITFNEDYTDILP